MESGCKLCQKPIIARGLCRNHYYQAKRAGTLLSNKTAHKTIKDRFSELYEVKETGCWEWSGHRRADGYGLIWKDRRAQRAHRISYEIHIGYLSDVDVVCHSCDNRGCVNPAHFFIGTRLDNNRDCAQKKRNAFGEKNGHAKLTLDQVKEIRMSTETQRKVAKKYGVNPSVISRIKGGKGWRH